MTDGYPGKPGDMFQDQDGGVYVHCADGRLRYVDASEDPYTPAELDDERGPLLKLGED
jgi:ligand-binding sensor domain-containing protein